MESTSEDLVRTESERERLRVAALQAEAERHQSDTREAERELQEVQRAIFKFGEASPFAATASPAAQPVFKFGSSSLATAPEWPVFTFGGSPAPAPAFAQPSWRSGTTGSVGSDAASPRPVFSFGETPAPAPAPRPVEASARPTFKFGSTSSATTTPARAADTPSPRPVFKFGGLPPPAAAPAAAAAPVTPSTPSMPTLRRNVDKTSATTTFGAAGKPSFQQTFKFGGFQPTAAPAAALAPFGLSTALGQLTSMGFEESEARAALLATRKRSIGQREIEEATQMLLTGAVPDMDDAPPHPVYGDHSPFGRFHRSHDEDRWKEPAAAEEDEFDPSDPASTTERIDQLMCLVASDDRYRTDEYKTCYHILMEKESVQWRVQQAAEWLFSRAGGDDSPTGLAALLDTLPVLFRVRAQDPVDIAAAQDLARTGSGSGRNDIVWEWEKGGGGFFGAHHHMMGARVDIYDETGRADPDRWGEYPVEAMAMLDVEWAKGEGARGAVLVRSGGSEYLVDLSQMTQSDVGGDHITSRLATRRVRRRRVRAEIGPLGRGETLSVMEDPSLAGDMIIVPQSYIERLDMFKIGRRNRAAVFRLSLQNSGGAYTGDHDTDSPRFFYCYAREFTGMEGTCAVPTWMARALQVPAFGSGESARVRVEPWLLPTCGGVKLKCITPGFEELVRSGAAEAADGSFDVTSVLSGPLSRDFCTLTSGSIVPIRCGEGGDVFEFIVTRLRRLRHPEEAEEEEADTCADATADPDGDLNVEGVDLKSVFNAELALDMTYLTDDVREIRKVAPNLDDAAARDVLQKVGFDLLAGLKAAEAAGAAKAVTDRKEQAREVKRLQHLAGVGRAEAERALSANDWSLAAAQEALAAGAEAESDDDEGAALTRGPSNNTLRNRRLQRLAGGGADQSPPPAVDAEHSSSEEDAVAAGAEAESDDEGAALTRGPSNNTLRNRRLQRLAGGGADQSGWYQNTLEGPAISPVDQPDLESNVIRKPAGVLTATSNSVSSRNPSADTGRQQRLAALEGRGTM